MPVNPGRYSVGTGWNGSHTNCCHFGWRLPCRLTVWILCLFQAKPFCFFYHALRAPCRVICKSKYWCVLQDCRLRAILSEKWQEVFLMCRKDASAKFVDTTETLIGHISGGVDVGGVWPQPAKSVWDQMGVWIRDIVDAASTVPELRRAVLQAWAAVRPGEAGTLGAVSIRKTVLLGMAIPMLKIRRPTGRLIFNMGIPIPGKTVFYIETGPRWIACHAVCALFSPPEGVIQGVMTWL